MPTAKTSLRIAALLFAIFALGHTYGALWLPSRGPVEDALFASMREFTFPAMGFERSHWDFYKGFALFLSVTLVAFVVLAWQVASLSSRHPREARRLTAVLCVTAIGFAVLSWWFFFAAPAIISTASALVLGAAAWVTRESPSPARGR